MASGDLNPWLRPRFEPGGGDALLFFAVYGAFSPDIKLSGSEYRTAGVAQGISIRKLNRPQSPEFPFTSGPIGQLLARDQAPLFEKIQTVPECMIIQGEIADPPDLNYLRDTVGLVMYFLEHGGIAVIDPQQFKLYDCALWREEMFQPQPPDLRRHVVILWSCEANDTKWFHTRGLRKFGRPDLSIHNVPTEYEKAIIDMFNRFILMQAQGGRIPDGQEIRMATLPPRLMCHHGGTLEDPDFNNVHVEIRWPA